MNSDCRLAKTRCTGWWMFGRPARPARRSDLRRRGRLMNSIRWSARLTNCWRRRESPAARARAKLQREASERAADLVRLPAGLPANDPKRAQLESDPLLRFVLLDSLADVLCPATKLWNTGWGAQMMREAVSLMGGYGITEDCPGFLGNKWMDAQLEATYEGPEAVQRRQLSITMTNPLFLAQFQAWIKEMRGIASERPGTGACALATAMGMWLWTLERLQGSTDADGGRLYQSARQGVTFPLADALCWLLAARCQILDALELERRGASDPAVAEGLAGLVNFMTDLCHVQSARASGEVARICAELVFGYNRHPAWDEAGYRGCYQQDELDSLEGIIPGIGSYGLDVIGNDGSHPKKAGPCAKCNGAEQFLSLQTKLSTCLTGCRLAKDRAAEAISKLMIPGGAGLPRMSADSPEQAPCDSKQQKIERQQMSVDIACVGFGPAMGGFLTTLSRSLLNADGSVRLESATSPGMPLQVICYERADGLGFGVSGAVTRARGIRGSFPGVDLTQIPMSAAVKKEKLVYLLDPTRASRRISTSHSRLPTACCARLASSSETSG